MRDWKSWRWHVLARPRTFAARAALVVAVAACGGPRASTAPAPRPADSDAAVAPAPPAEVTLSIVGTNDLHGHLVPEGERGGLAVFGGYVANLRKARAADGAVLLVDAGDAFQGTIESNLNEGAAVIEAYNLLGYAAMTVGNHEFDYGPVGEAAVARGDRDDPRGALKARLAEAKFPLLAANVIDEATGKPFADPAATIEVAGVKVGVIGVTTMSTPYTTMAANFKGLRMAPIADTIATHAAALRGAGCAVIVVAAHAGSMCREFSDPRDTSSCRQDEEIFEVARALEPGAVDVIVAGHTHAGVAHVVNGIAIIESFRYGTAFGRVDLTVDRAANRVTSARIHPPREMCARVAQGTDRCSEVATGAEWVVAEYEGAPVLPDARVASALEPHLRRAAERREEKLGVTLATPIPRAHGEESALGNLFTDLMRASRAADVAITNGGGLRQDLPVGELTYGRLYEASPFDNRFAIVTMNGANLREVIAGNLGRSSGIFSVSGVRVRARCAKGALEVELERDEGGKKKPRPIRDDEKVVVVTSDFLATGGDGAFTSLRLPEGAIVVEDGDSIRDVMADALRKRGGTLRAEDYHDPKRPRLEYPGRRPVSCAKAP